MSRPSVLQAFADAGLWPGMRRSAAAGLAAAGVLTPEDVSKDALTKLPTVSPMQAQRLVSSFAAAAEAYDVVELLVGAGVNARLAGQAARAIGPGAAAAVRDDPWRLLDAEAAAVGEADILARYLGTGTAEQRGRAIVGWVLRKAAREGNTALPAARVAQLLGEFRADPAVAIPAAVESGRVLADRPGVPGADGDEGPELLLSLERYAMAEDAVANGLARLLAAAKPLATATGADLEGLDEAQAAGVAGALEHGVSLLTGGPGTGKSRTVAALVSAAAAAGSRIALAAPTGRAAKRLEELTGGEVPATTLHRLLGAQGTSGEFARGEAWPLDADLVVVDETSMLDAELAAALVGACADGTHLLLVGDPAQLPSIGAGRVLGDLVDVAAASDLLQDTALERLYRQAEGGAIARLATGVRSGLLPTPPPPEETGFEVVVVPARKSEDAALRVVQLVTRSIPSRLSIPAADVQVVTPVHRGPAGTTELNRLLKAALNPGAGERGGFDVGDRVVATANHLELDGGFGAGSDGGGRGFANGEVGVVVGLGEKSSLTVAFAGGLVDVPSAAFGDLMHGWAITVHRAQGSEWPAVVVVVPSEVGPMLSRPLIYTAFTRAQKHLSIVTTAGPGLARAVASASARPRVTRLTALLRDELEALS